jgi:hypothetical protein
MTSIAQGLTAFAVNMRTQMPLHGAIPELVDAMAEVQRQLANVSAEIKPAIGRIHAEDLARHEHPRPGEDTWNV